MKKGCVIAACVGIAGVAVVVAGCAGIIFLAFGLTAGAVDEADRFLSLLGEGRTQEAYESTSATFRSEETEESFAETVSQLGLDEFESAAWNSRSVENDLATLEGSVTTRQGTKIPLKVELIKEQEQWKVVYLRGPNAGATVAAGSNELPSDVQLNRLAEQSLSDLNAALQARDFSDLHASISELWQSQVTKEELLAAFQSLIDQQVDLGEPTKTEPVFDVPPSINDDGILVLSGYYPGELQRTVFGLTYTHEDPNWKLIGIQVYVEPDPSTIPQGEVLEALVTKTLLDFNDALQAKDFTSFYETTSKVWQGQTSAEQLADVFKAFVENQIDISPIKTLSPEFESPPSIGEKGVLNVAGFFPTEPARVSFDLDFVYERSEWKLVGISLNLQE